MISPEAVLYYADHPVEFTEDIICLLYTSPSPRDCS